MYESRQLQRCTVTDITFTDLLNFIAFLVIKLLKLQNVINYLVAISRRQHCQILDFVLLVTRTVGE